MAHTYRWATANVTAELVDENDVPAPAYLQAVESIVLTLTQADANVQIVKTQEDLVIDLERASISCVLTQEETARLKTGSGTAQINIYYTNGCRNVSARAAFQIKKNDYEGVMA